MKLIIDTNAYAKCELGDEKAIECLSNAREWYIPSIVFGELYFGFKHGTRFISNMHRLEKFIEKYDVSVLPIDKDAALCYGEIYAYLRKHGKPIPTNDIWIAASCMSLGGVLLTSDKHFDAVPQIRTQVI